MDLRAAVMVILARVKGTIPSLVWLQSPTGDRIPVRGSCFIGRSAACEVVLNNAKASRQHALIHGQEHGEFWLVDLGSANGTYLNGRRLIQPCRLSDGDKITLAGLTLTFRRPNSVGRSGEDSSVTEATIHEVRHLTCWLLIADIQGSTRLLRELPAEEAPRIVGKWLSACSKIINDHHGAIDKFLGDGFMAYWPEDARAAASVTGALSSLRAMQQTENPRFRTVLHFGKASTGGAAPGGDSLTGHDVNFAFRLEKLVAGLGCPRLLSEPAQKQIRLHLPVTAAGSHSLPGFEGQFAFFAF